MKQPFFLAVIFYLISNSFSIKHLTKKFILFENTSTGFYYLNIFKTVSYHKNIVITIKKISIESTAEMSSLSRLINDNSDIFVFKRIQMETGNLVTIQASVNAHVEKTWKAWTTPNDIVQWNNASEDWQTTKAENDLRVGGKFSSRMEAKDGSFGFDFSGIYTKVIPGKLIEYTLEDSRKVKVEITYDDNKTTITETFEAEKENSIEMQRTGWQAILDNFKKYIESN